MGIAGEGDIGCYARVKFLTMANAAGRAVGKITRGENKYAAPGNAHAWGFLLYVLWRLGVIGVCCFFAAEVIRHAPNYIHTQEMLPVCETASAPASFRGASGAAMSYIVGGWATWYSGGGRKPTSTGRYLRKISAPIDFHLNFSFHRLPSASVDFRRIWAPAPANIVGLRERYMAEEVKVPNPLFTGN